jgi:hypothetical protein
MNWQDPMSVWTAAGTVASVVGLIIGVVLIVIGSGARKAAIAAKVAAQAAAQRRSLVEELEAVSQKLGQLSYLLRDEQWTAAHMRTDEILATCQVVLTRWPDGLSEARKNDVLSATQLARSIAGKISGQTEFTPTERKRLATTQSDLSGLVAAALGEARKIEERT